MTVHSPDPPSTALPVAQRSLAPDLARGTMLLVIAIAHARILATMSGGAKNESHLDTVAELLLPMFVDGRGYPMFAALFGYGLCQIYLRRQAQQWPWERIRSLVRRRGRWLVLLGMAHVILLFFGDILAIYGLVALTCAALLHSTDRALLRHAAGWLVAGSLVYASMLTYAALTSGAEAQTSLDPFSEAGFRIFMWPVFAIPMFATTVFPFLIGVWAGRRRLLEEPVRHLGLLRPVAGIGVTAGALGGLPSGLYSAGIWQDASIGTVYAIEWLTTVAGYAGGLGYAALIALIAVRLSGAPGRFGAALAATGQRSMTCYLLQSVAWAVLFPSYLLGLGTRLSPATAVAVGAGVWLVTVGIAEVMRRRQWRGPAERLLRARTYRERHRAPVD